MKPQDEIASRRELFRKGAGKLGEHLADLLERQLKKVDVARRMAGIYEGEPLVPPMPLPRSKRRKRTPSDDAAAAAADAADAGPPPCADSNPADRAISSPGGPTTGLFRPPGAIVESAFLDTCDPSCRECIVVCPRNCLVPSQEHHPGPDGYPIILPNTAACDLCMKCTEICPTGALQPVAREEVWIGTAVPLLERCSAVRGSGCERCVTHCPFPDEAITMVPMTADDFVAMGAAEPDSFAIGGTPKRPVVDGERCTGCGLCVEACPQMPKALEVIAWEDE